MRYRFYLDGNLLQDEPTGWKELLTSITYYEEIRGVLLTQDVTLGFVGDGYTYLWNLFTSNNVCALTELRIEYACTSNYEEIFKGTIFITSLNFLNNVCKIKPEDNSFFARINNNKNIKAYINVDRSKNDETIIPVTNKDLKMFDPCTPCPATALGDTRKAYSIFDCFEYIVSFMSDGEVSFVSDSFDVGGIWEGDVLTTGLAIRDITSTDIKSIPFISFREIFEEINKKYNIGLSVETIAGVPTVRIEQFSYFRTLIPDITLSDPMNVEISTDVSQLYANVKIGSDKTEQFQDCLADFPENVDFVGFKEEEFPILTECNIDTTLNLVSSWIISSNTIQRIFNGNDQYDENIVLISATRSDAVNHVAIQTDVFSDGNCYYNDFYSNSNVLQRWNSALPNIVQVILGSQNNLFDAFRIPSNTIVLTPTSPTYATTTSDGFGNPIEGFADDWSFGFDDSIPSTNNYGRTVNPVVVVPQGTNVGVVESIYEIATNGNYQFVSGTILKNVRCAIILNGDAILTATITINHYDATGVLINTYPGSVTQTIIGGNLGVDVPVSTTTGIIAGNVGEYLSVEYNFTSAFTGLAFECRFVLPGQNVGSNITYFSCNFFQGFGGELVRVNNADFANILFKFEYPITYEQHKTIKSDTKKPIAFNWCNKMYNGWIKDIKYNHHKNSKLVLLTNKNGIRNN